jgi:hypothetical protein
MRRVQARFPNDGVSPASTAVHRRLEEEVILPAARQRLTEDEWNEIDDAFGANRDPFAGVKVEADLGRLFVMIVKAIREG